MRRTWIVSIAVATAVALAGCAPATPEPSPAPSQSESPGGSPTAAATPPADETLTLVDCESLVPIETVRATLSADAEFIGELPPTQFTGWFELTAVADGLGSASQGILCSWGVPASDGGLFVHVAEIAPETRSEIEAALTAAGFTAVTMGTVTGHDAAGEGALSTIAATHLFTGDVWIMASANTLATSGEVAGSALDALRTANPAAGL